MTSSLKFSLCTRQKSRAVWRGGGRNSCMTTWISGRPARPHFPLLRTSCKNHAHWPPCPVGLGQFLEVEFVGSKGYTPKVVCSYSLPPLPSLPVQRSDRVMWNFPLFFCWCLFIVRGDGFGENRCIHYPASPSLSSPASLSSLVFLVLPTPLLLSCLMCTAF